MDNDADISGARPPAGTGRHPDRHAFIAVLGGLPVVRTEAQSWSRGNAAAGLLDIGYDDAERVVRVEYHWWRWFSRVNPVVADVYTAELWVRRPGGDWTYLLHPTAERPIDVPHDRVRPVLRTGLNIDIGD